MSSSELQEQIYQWALSKGFNAPYGVLSGEHANKKGTKYLSVAFGRARTMDAVVEIYNQNWVLVRTTRHGLQAFKNVAELQRYLDTL